MKGQGCWLQQTGAKYGNPAARLQFQNINIIRIIIKKKVEITLFLVMTNRPKQDSVFYGLFCSVKHCDGLGLPSEDLRNLFGCICQFQFNLDGERIQSISAGA